MIDSLKFTTVKNIIKKKSIDDGIFQLHYKVTTLLLLWTCVLISCKQFFGEPIKCMTNSKTYQVTDIHNMYCWIHGTYTSRSNIPHVIGKNAISPGVGIITKDDKEYYHLYYQWVCVILILQAGMFYIPRFLWKIFEGGRIELLSNKMGTIVIDSDKWNEDLKNKLVQYFIDMDGHNFYIMRYVFCEFLNLINVVFQIILLNVFLGGSFSNYGPAVASFFYNPNIPNSEDPMALIFPKMTKCTFRYFGNSGSINTLELICVLPLNVINEKVFAFLWFWYFILGALTFISFFVRVVTFCSTRVRSYFISNQIRTIPKFQIKKIVDKLSIGDWFLLHQLGKSIDPRIFRDIILDMEIKMEKKTVVI